MFLSFHQCRFVFSLIIVFLTLLSNICNLFALFLLLPFLSSLPLLYSFFFIFSSVSLPLLSLTSPTLSSSYSSFAFPSCYFFIFLFLTSFPLLFFHFFLHPSYILRHKKVQSNSQLWVDFSYLLLNALLPWNKFQKIYRKIRGPVNQMKEFKGVQALLSQQRW